MISRISLILFIIMMLLISPQANAKDYLVWSDDVVNVYVDDNTINWKNSSYVELEINVRDKEGNGGRYESLAFFKESGNWYYKDIGRSWNGPVLVTYDDSPGYILDFALKYL